MRELGRGKLDLLVEFDGGESAAVESSTRGTREARSHRTQ